MSSFSQVYKLRPETLTAWAGALRRLPPSCVLRLLRFEPSAVATLHAELSAHGLHASHRLEFLPKLPREEHLLRASTSASLSLDTPGYNGGTSGLDALWAGLPLLTLPLREWAERMGASLVSHAGIASATAHSMRAIDDVAVAMLAGEEAAAARVRELAAEGRSWLRTQPSGGRQQGDTRTSSVQLRRPMSIEVTHIG